MAPSRGSPSPRSPSPPGRCSSPITLASLRCTAHDRRFAHRRCAGRRPRRLRRPRRHRRPRRPRCHRPLLLRHLRRRSRRSLPRPSSSRPSTSCASGSKTPRASARIDLVHCPKELGLMARATVVTSIHPTTGATSRAALTSMARAAPKTIAAHVEAGMTALPAAVRRCSCSATHSSFSAVASCRARPRSKSRSGAAQARPPS